MLEHLLTVTLNNASGIGLTDEQTRVGAGMDTGRVDPWVGSGRNFLNALFLFVSRVK